MVYVFIDGKWHEQTGELDGKTACGLDIPFGTEWSRAEPDEPCDDCQKAAA